MAALLSLIPIKDWIYLLVIAAILVGGAYEYEHLQAVGAARQHAADIAADTKLANAVKAQVAADNADYQARLQTITENQNAALQAAADRSNDLTARLRGYEARRCPVLSGPATAAAPAAAGPSSVDDAVAGLVSAAAHDNAIIEAERAERDALTGK